MLAQKSLFNRASVKSQKAGRDPTFGFGILTFTPLDNLPPSESWEIRDESEYMSFSRHTAPNISRGEFDIWALEFGIRKASRFVLRKGGVAKKTP